MKVWCEEEGVSKSCCEDEDVVCSSRGVKIKSWRVVLKMWCVVNQVVVCRVLLVVCCDRHLALCR